MLYRVFEIFALSPLMIDNQYPIILDLIVISIGCVPSSACNMLIGVLFGKFVILRKN